MDDKITIRVTCRKSNINGAVDMLTKHAAEVVGDKSGTSAVFSLSLQTGLAFEIYRTRSGNVVVKEMEVEE